jgi:BirA family transcriptional regulator, biotin operon repressor / biotin---[acetyl-CoA-carboxylase] ligase
MCHSTNEYAEKLIEDNNFFEGTTILTLNQTNGKGQRGNKWESEPGENLTFSIILKPNFLSIGNQFYLNIISSLSILKVLTKISSGFKVKWPNDIYWYNQKLGGILIENKLKIPQIDSSVVGIGLNINQEGFPGLNATSIKQISKKQHDIFSLLEELLYEFESYYLKLKTGDHKGLLKEYLKNLYWINEVHTFKSDHYFIGEIIGIDPIGRLEVVVENEVRTFDLKEIQFIE